MATDLILVENTNNLEISNFDLQITTDNLTYVSQKLRIRLSFFKGEWYLNMEFGLPYYDDILKKAPNLDNIEAIIKEQILDLPEIESITSFSMTLNTNRTLTVTFAAVLVTNEILEFSEVI